MVSAASGAVGSVVGQLAKAWGCRAVGIAGGKAKCDYVVKELGFDACVDYKAGNLQRDLKAACPKGIDVLLRERGRRDARHGAARMMNVHSRIVVCGLISDYNATEPYGVKTFRSVLVNRITDAGHHRVRLASSAIAEARNELAGLVAAGKLKYRESVRRGHREARREAFIGLLKGENFGKQLVKI